MQLLQFWGNNDPWSVLHFPGFFSPKAFFVFFKGIVTPGLYSPHFSTFFFRCLMNMFNGMSSSSGIIPQESHFHLHLHDNPLGLGEVFDDEMFEEDLEGDPVGEVFEDDPGCVPVGDNVTIDSLESDSST